MTETTGVMALVASRRPPMPVSRTMISHSVLAEVEKAERGGDFEKGGVRVPVAGQFADGR